MNITNCTHEMANFDLFASTCGITLKFHLKNKTDSTKIARRYDFFILITIFFIKQSFSCVFSPDFPITQLKYHIYSLHLDKFQLYKI